MTDPRARAVAYATEPLRRVWGSGDWGAMVTAVIDSLPADVLRDLADQRRAEDDEEDEVPEEEDPVDQPEDEPAPDTVDALFVRMVAVAVAAVIEHGSQQPDPYRAVRRSKIIEAHLREVM